MGMSKKKEIARIDRLIKWAREHGIEGIDRDDPASGWFLACAYNEGFMCSLMILKSELTGVPFDKIQREELENRNHE